MMKTIDIHTHQPLRWRGSHGFPEDPRKAADTLLEQMNLAGVAISGLLGGCVAPGKTAAEVREINGNTAQVIDQEPTRFYGMAFVNPTLGGDEVRAELDCTLSDQRFRGIKLERCVNCRDPRLDVVMEKAAEYDVPVLHHSWYLNLRGADQWSLESQIHRSEPHDIAALARRFPGVRIIMAHLEGCGVRGILDVADLPNVWVDTSGAQPFTGTLEYAVQMLGSERILFGSDLTGRSLESQLGRVYGSTLTEAQREQILHHNAAELFSINGNSLS